MLLRSHLPAPGRRILDLARRDRRAAREALAGVPLDEQVALVCRAPLAERARLIDLSPIPEQLVPALPEAELCWIAKEMGLTDSGWLLEHATAAQLVACVDLDAWHDLTPDRERLSEWLRALADAGDATLLRSAHALDPETLVLMLADRLEVWLDPREDSWQPPPGAHTLDGQFFFRARRDGDDLADITALLGALRQDDYWAYFRLLQGVNWELPTENEEWALRWRTGRLLDLGFPEWDESMAIYSTLPADDHAKLPEQEHVAAPSEWALAIFPPDAPVPSEAAPSLMRALAALPEDERRAQLYAFVALANKVAVAERLPLGDAESIPRAFELAAELASHGLDFVATQNSVEPAAVLHRLPLEHLFRVGVNRVGHRPPATEPEAEPLPPDDELE